ncbi:MAG: hypothetical protein OEY49_14310, partial [Candidatus Heimdallarchaeota archaeon]|nr:hypothetical protein [Candidatus Heimdallarchaeota archaeon]
IKLNGLAIIKKVIRAFPNFSILKRMKQLVHEVQVMGDIYNNYPDDPSKLSDWIEERDNLLGEKL